MKTVPIPRAYGIEYHAIPTKERIADTYFEPYITTPEPRATQGNATAPTSVLKVYPFEKVQPATLAHHGLFHDNSDTQSPGDIEMEDIRSEPASNNTPSHYDYDDLLNLSADGNDSDIGTQDTSTDLCAPVWRDLYINYSGGTKGECRCFCGRIAIIQDPPTPNITQGNARILEHDLIIETFSRVSDIRRLIRAVAIKTVAFLNRPEEESKPLVALRNYMVHHDLVSVMTFATSYSSC